MLGTDYTGIFEDDGEEDKDNERTTEQRFESRRVTRYATPDMLRIYHARYATDTPRQIRQIRHARYATDTPDTPRYAEPAARVRYKYETCFGKNGRAGMIGSIYSLHFVVCCYY